MMKIVILDVVSEPISFQVERTDIPGTVCGLTLTLNSASTDEEIVEKVGHWLGDYSTLSAEWREQAVSQIKTHRDSLRQEILACERLVKQMRSR